MRARWIISCTLLLVYAYSFPYFDGLKSANELPRIFLTTELVDHATFRIDARARDLGSRFDVATTPDGHMYSNKAPGLSLLAVPTYVVLRGLHAIAGGSPSLAEVTWAFRFTAVTLPAVLFLPLWLAFARRFAPGRPLAQRAGLVAFALGSLAMPYSIVFFSHQLGAVLVGAAFVCAVTLVRDPVARRARWAVAVGAFAGAAVLVDYQAALAGLAVGLYLLLRSPRRWRDAAIAAAAALPAALMLGVYHAACFGSPLRTGYSFAADPAHERGVLGIIGLNATALYNATLAPDNGLITLSPWVVLALVGCVAIARSPQARRRIGVEALVCAVIVAAYLLFIGSLVPEFGRAGWSVGPRYIAAAMPFCAWLAVAGLAAVDGHAPARVVAQAMIWVGVVVFTTAAATFPHWPTPSFANPLYEVSLRLIRTGHAPHSLGTWLGLRGVAAYLPLLVAVAILAAWLMAGRDRARWRGVAIAALIAAAIVWMYGWFPRGGASAEHGWRYILSIWEP